MLDFVIHLTELASAMPVELEAIVVYVCHFFLKKNYTLHY